MPYIVGYINNKTRQHDKQEALKMTLNEIHSMIQPIYLSLKSAAVWTDCHRCCGKGGINAFSHVYGGICFRCRGGKIIPSNQAAKNAAKLSLHYRALSRSWNMGITELEHINDYKELIKLIDRIPKKYKQAG